MADQFTWEDRTATLADLTETTGGLRDALVAAERQDAWLHASSTVD
jgi:hypothetical protein